MSRELPIGEFGWVEETSQFNKDFIKNYNEDRDIGYFIQVDAQNLKNLCKTQNDLPIFPEIIKIEKKNGETCSQFP